MRELIMDRGSEFGAHRVPESGKWNGQFKIHLEKTWYQANSGQSQASLDQWKIGKVVLICI
jgi:hypothetical protein